MVRSMSQPSLPPYFDGLNPPQREAAQTLDGALLILAGAGTGKTRVLTTRLAHILYERRAQPSQILAVTFTNKAAREMKERVDKLVGGATEGIWMGTFHSIGVRILRRDAERLGFTRDFTIIDMDDQLRLIKQLLSAANLDEKQFPARLMLSVIQRWKDRAFLPLKVPASEAQHAGGGQAIALYHAYQERLATLNAMDFGDLLLQCLRLFQEQPDVLKRYQQQFHYILIDEYQDTNTAQYLWMRLLAQGHGNLCVVGDDDQSIYGWRGAEIGNILKFEKDFSGAKTIRLEQNYRSTSPILAAASALIAHNQGRLGKTLWTNSHGGEPVRVRGVWDGAEEARCVGDEIEALHGKPFTLNDMAILVRAGFQTREFEERLLTLGIPYRVIGGRRFYERQEIKDALAYLRLIYQQRDDLAFERIINLPKRGIGAAALQTLHDHARARHQSLMEASIALAPTDAFKGAARQGLRQFVQLIQHWRSLAAQLAPSELAQVVLDESGYTEMWQQDKSPDATGRLENLKELARAMEDFESLPAFLEHVSLVMDMAENESSDMVTLMTLHGAKGLEFPVVFLPGWEEGLFPSQRSLDEKGNEGLEEERRLAYVGLTRARERAYIFYAANRRVHYQWVNSAPSRFLRELPNEHIEEHTLHGFYGQRQMPSSFDAVTPAPWQPRFAKTIDVKPLPRPTATGLVLGGRIYHETFGYGKICAMSGDKLDVVFENNGLKKVMASFVEPA